MEKWKSRCFRLNKGIEGVSVGFDFLAVGTGGKGPYSSSAYIIPDIRPEKESPLFLPATSKL